MTETSTPPTAVCWRAAAAAARLVPRRFISTALREVEALGDGDEAGHGSNEIGMHAHHCPSPYSSLYFCLYALLLLLFFFFPPFRYSPTFVRPTSVPGRPTISIFIFALLEFKFVLIFPGRMPLDPRDESQYTVVASSDTDR